MKFFSYIRRRPILVGIIATLSLFVASFSVWVRSSKAVLPFGGSILSVTYCTCSGNVALTLGPPTPGIYSYNPYSTVLFPFQQVYRPGPWILGGYVPEAVCLVGVPPACTAGSAPFGTITMAGTSM